MYTEINAVCSILFNNNFKSHQQANQIPMKRDH